MHWLLLDELESLDLMLFGVGQRPLLPAKPGIFNIRHDLSPTSMSLSFTCNSIPSSDRFVSSALKRVERWMHVPTNSLIGLAGLYYPVVSDIHACFPHLRNTTLAPDFDLPSRRLHVALFRTPR